MVQTTTSMPKRLLLPHDSSTQSSLVGYYSFFAEILLPKKANDFSLHILRLSISLLGCLNQLTQRHKDLMCPAT